MEPTVEPFNPPCTRNPIGNHKPSQELDDGFFRAYQAIIEDALLLEQGASNRPQEFVQLIVVVTEILQWASSNPGNKTAAKTLQDMIQSNPLTEEEKQCVPKLPADDCLCLLVRLLARKKQPTTPVEYLNELQKLKIHTVMTDAEQHDDNLQRSCAGVYGIPNHISICIGSHIQTSSQPNICLHIIATNGEHHPTYLGKWAKKSRKTRFENLQSNVPQHVTKAGLWLDENLRDDDRDGTQAINTWKLESTPARSDAEPTDRPQHFNHENELAITFTIQKGRGITRCERCAICRMLFWYRQDDTEIGIENNPEPREEALKDKGIYRNNTCSEGLLHELCEMAERMAAKTQPGTTGTTDQDPDSGEAL
ncbi:hypothetical protein AYO21_00106 [Fonsecaea monophora]|uniref:Uncharacterized protein n=1 Tax=Fonsecaea monophora TaxID=254056 RepID=A0A177FQ39_9EURO|nr:hypothetical protein AYO21_00106 [Fonsecaea monophora]OAG45472.1 hypothetical protein AYO21_00106 [Fonsecaea monophora]